VWRVSAYDKAGKQVATMDLINGEITIGRDADRQLMLPSASVSRRHARVVVQGGQPCVVDDGSSNGVLVNGVRIAAVTAVGPNTQVDLAEFRITVEPLTQTEGVAPLPPPRPAAADDGLRLVGETGAYAGRDFPLPMSTLTVGRAADNDVVFDDPSLSRKHARLHRSPNAVEIEDLGSSNGTYINGRRLGKGAAGPGDTIRFGDLNFKVVGNAAPASFANNAGASGRAPAMSSGDGDDQEVSPVPILVGAIITLAVVVTAVVFLFKKPPTIAAPGKDAVAKLMKQAEDHLDTGKQLFKAKKYSEAKEELEQALELDPANVDARKLRLAAAHGADDDRALSSATAALGVGDRHGLETGLKAMADMSDGSPARDQLLQKLGPALVRYGNDSFAKKAYAETGWSVCKALDLVPDRVDAKAKATLREAEKKLKKDKSYIPCSR